MAKKRCFGDGGEVREGAHTGIDDDTRARAMKWLREGSPEQPTPKATPRRPTPPSGDTEGEAQARVNRLRASTPRRPAVLMTPPEEAETHPEETTITEEVEKPRALTREERIEQIPRDNIEQTPRDKSRDPDGERVSGSDLSRNFSNTLNAMVGTRLPRVVAGVVGELMAAKTAVKVKQAADAKAAQEKAALAQRIAARRASIKAKQDETTRAALRARAVDKAREMIPKPASGRGVSGKKYDTRKTEDARSTDMSRGGVVPRGWGKARVR